MEDALRELWSLKVALISCLNPYCNGLLELLFLPVITKVKPVLILIVMEDALRET